jgi:hypothetical protein
MSNRDGYYLDLFVASLLRGGLLLGILAVMAMMSGCSPFPSAKDVLPKMSSDALSFQGGETDQTRNQLPQRGCDEKSDSSLRGPVP